MPVLSFSKSQSQQLQRMAFAAFLERLRTQMAEDYDAFATLPETEQTAVLEQSVKRARDHHFISERALAYWANLDFNLPRGWSSRGDIPAVIADLGPSEPERLFRVKTAVEALAWNG